MTTLQISGAIGLIIMFLLAIIGGVGSFIVDSEKYKDK